MSMKFAVASILAGSLSMLAPALAPAAPGDGGYGIFASHVDYRYGGHRRHRGDHYRHRDRHHRGAYRDYRHRDRHYRGGRHRDHEPFSHGYRHGHRNYYRGYGHHGPRRHYRQYRHYGGHYYAPPRHYHRYRPVVQLYADYDAYFHCPAHGGYFRHDDLYYD